jgi:hypothetical protein
MKKELKDAKKSGTFKRFLELTEELKSGKRKKWILENNSEEFNEAIALKNFKSVMDSGITQRHMKEMKKLYGR